MKKFYSSADIGNLDNLINRVLQIKKSPFLNGEVGRNKTLLLLFFNSSLRTRLSTQRAAQNLGMEVISMNLTDGWNLEIQDGVIMNLDKPEHIKDAAKVISKYADIIAIRSFPKLIDRVEDEQDNILKAFIKYADIPVVNLESAQLHPLQSLADFVTIEELRQKEKNKIVVSWAPHPKSLPHAVVNSFLDFGRLTKNEIIVCHPPGYELDNPYGAAYPVSYDQEAAFAGADFIYVKNWSSTNPYGKNLNTDPRWMIDERQMNLTNNAKLMHCLPIRRNVVASDSVLDGSQSAIYQQAGNRLFATQAVLEKILINL